MSVLAKEPLGSFMVRNSETQPGTLALSVLVPDTFHPLGITHYIINILEKGYQIKVLFHVLPRNTSFMFFLFEFFLSIVMVPHMID